MNIPEPLQTLLNSLQTGMAVFKNISAIVAGGPPMWIAAGVVLLVLVGLYLKFKATINDWIRKFNESKKNSDIAAAPVVNQEMEQDAQTAADRVDQVAKENPDDHKKPIPPEPPQI